MTSLGVANPDARLLTPLQIRKNRIPAAQVVFGSERISAFVAIDGLIAVPVFQIRYILQIYL